MSDSAVPGRPQSAASVLAAQHRKNLASAISG